MSDQTSGYDQFIEGKIRGGTNYETIAHTSSFGNVTRIDQIKTHCGQFFAEAPGENPQAMAIGVFHQENLLVLVQSAHATEQNGQLARDFQGRFFTQSRYILIPTEIVLQLVQGKTFKFISWLRRQLTPVLSETTADFPPLPVQVLQEAFSPDSDGLQKAIEKIGLCLTNQTAGKPTLLMVLAALLNQQRILIDWPSNTTLPPFYLESVLLLLPARLRSKIAFAFGNLDEQNCNWAQIIIKTNGVPKKLSENTIWLDFRHQEFTEEASASVFTHPYIDHFLQPLTTRSETISELLQALDAISESCDDFADLLAPEFLIHLMPLLPELQRIHAYQTYFSDLTVDQWSRLMPVIQSDPVGLAFAWKQLSTQVGHSEQRPQAVALMLQIWRQLPPSARLHLLPSLKVNLALTKHLLLGGLLQSDVQSDLTSDEALRIQQKLVSLSQAAVVATEPKLAATQLAERLAQSDCFQNQPVEQFGLFDATLAGQPQIEGLLQQLHRLLVLLPHLSIQQFEQSHLARQCDRLCPAIGAVLTNLLTDREQPLNCLPELADLLNSAVPERDTLYAAFLKTWLPSFKAASPLLCAAISQARSQAVQLTTCFSQTCAWFEQQKPELKPILAEFDQFPTWQTWQLLATALFEKPTERVAFLEAQVGEQFLIEVLQDQLSLIHDEASRQQFMQTSQFWQQLSFDDLSHLVTAAPHFAPLLALYLKDARRTAWLKGELLHALCQRWVQQKFIEADLKSLIQSVEVTEAWSDRDWLEVQQVQWTSEIELELPLKRPSLSADQKRHLFNYARGVINRSTFEQGQNLLHDCYAWQLDAADLKTLTIQLVQKCQQPEQTQTLLALCSTWKMSVAEQKAVLAQAPPAACTVTLILKYLNFDDSSIHTSENFALVKLMFQISDRTESETAQLKDRVVTLLKGWIAQPDPVMWQKWQHQIFGLNQTLYEELLGQVIQESVQMHLRSLETQIRQIKQSATAATAKLVDQAVYTEIEQWCSPLRLQSEDVPQTHFSPFPWTGE